MCRPCGVVQVLKSDKVRPKYQVCIRYDRKVNEHQVGSDLDHDGERSEERRVGKECQ